MPRTGGDRFSEGPVLNPQVVRLELVDDPERRVKGVLRNLKVAAQQVTRDLRVGVHRGESGRSRPGRG